MDTIKRRITRIKQIRQKALDQLKDLQQQRHNPLYREQYLELKMAVDLANEAIDNLTE